MSVSAPAAVLAPVLPYQFEASFPELVPFPGTAGHGGAELDRALTLAREAGVRNLEREIATICRKVAKQVAEGRKILEELKKEKPATEQ